MTDQEPIIDARERRLIDAVVTLAKSFRDDRDRLARRLTQLEHEIETLAVRLESRETLAPVPVPIGLAHGPSRTPL
jgi:hypothetical protein